MPEKDFLILGKGYLGTRLHEAMPEARISGARVETLGGALRLLDQHQPKVVINAIGFTGTNNVDDCEKDIEKTLQANTVVPVILAEACLRRGIKFVHVSSGCIYHYDYEKSRPIRETRDPDYFDLYYSRTKIYSERALEILSRHFPVLVTRIRIPLDNRPHPKNILTKLITYGKVIDVPNSITYIPDFVAALRHLIKVDARGIYNVVNKGALRYPEFMRLYETYMPGFQYEVIPYKNLNLRRTNLVMSCRKLEQIGFRMRPVRAVLAESIEGYLAAVSQRPDEK